jgi:hypothetical protein
MPTPAEIKKALLKAGFEVYQTRGDVVHIADRVRENLIMDAGVKVRATGPAVGFVARAQKSDFPAESEDALFERARRLAAPAVACGYAESGIIANRVFDPGDTEKIIEVFYEVHFEKPVGTIDEAIEEARFAFALEKVASPK